MVTPGRSPVRRLVEAYERPFRDRMTVSPEGADDPAQLAVAAAALPVASAGLLDLALLVAPVGEALPDRLRPLVERAGEPLWLAGILLPRTTVSPGGSILPTHYAAQCRLNPALLGHPPHLLGLADVVTIPAGADRPTFPPADARWDAVIVAAAVEANPPTLREDGAVRRDVEKRLFASLGGDADRWSLALRVARAQGLVRVEGNTLKGLPEATPRSIPDPAVLFDSPVAAQAAGMVLRLVRDEWLAVPGLLGALRDRCRELFYSPRGGAYPDGRRFDDAGWALVEEVILTGALDTLHRSGWLDAHRDGSGIVSVRRAGPRVRHDEGFLLTPDGEALVPVGALPGPDYGRLARMAPFLDGERLCRHRLGRDGVSADMAAGHGDAVEFLTRWSRTGLAPGLADALREWQRSASRLTILTGVDVEEDESGQLRLALRPPDGPYRVIDYLPSPRARFLYQRGRILIPHGWDPLTVRGVVATIARRVESDGDAHEYVPERRPHRDTGALLDRLREFHGGELPGEIEAIVLAGGGLPPVRVESAVVVHVPGQAAAALRRDWVAGPLLHRWIAADQVVVARTDLDALRARLTELGLAMEGDLAGAG